MNGMKWSEDVRRGEGRRGRTLVVYTECQLFALVVHVLRRTDWISKNEEYKSVTCRSNAMQCDREVMASAES